MSIKVFKKGPNFISEIEDNRNYRYIIKAYSLDGKYENTYYSNDTFFSYNKAKDSAIDFIYKVVNPSFDNEGKPIVNMTFKFKIEKALEDYDEDDDIGEIIIKKDFVYENINICNSSFKRLFGLNTEYIYVPYIYYINDDSESIWIWKN